MFLFLSVQFAEKLIRIRYDRAVQKIRIQKEPKKRTQQQFCKRLKKNPVVLPFTTFCYESVKPERTKRSARRVLRIKFKNTETDQIISPIKSERTTQNQSCKFNDIFVYGTSYYTFRMQNGICYFFHRQPQLLLQSTCYHLNFITQKTVQIHNCKTT